MSKTKSHLQAEEEAGRPPTRIVPDGRYWDRHDAERHHLQRYIQECEAANRKPIMRFVLRDGKTVAGQFVELAIYVYAIDAKVGDQVRRVLVSKHAIDYVILGEEPGG